MRTVRKAGLLQNELDHAACFVTVRLREAVLQGHDSHSSARADLFFLTHDDWLSAEREQGSLGNPKAPEMVAETSKFVLSQTLFHTHRCFSKAIPSCEPG